MLNSDFNIMEKVDRREQKIEHNMFFNVGTHVLLKFIGGHISYFHILSMSGHYTLTELIHVAAFQIV